MNTGRYPFSRKVVKQLLLLLVVAAAGCIATDFRRWSKWQEGSVFYPHHAVFMGMEGTVGLEVEISKSGACSAVTVTQSSGRPLLDQAARASVALWPLERNLPPDKRKRSIELVFKITSKTLSRLPPSPFRGDNHPRLAISSKDMIPGSMTWNRTRHAHFSYRFSSRGYVTECLLEKGSGDLLADSLATIQVLSTVADEEQLVRWNEPEWRKKEIILDGDYSTGGGGSMFNSETYYPRGK